MITCLVGIIIFDNQLDLDWPNRSATECELFAQIVVFDLIEDEVGFGSGGAAQISESGYQDVL